MCKNLQWQQTKVNATKKCVTRLPLKAFCNSKMLRNNKFVPDNINQPRPLMALAVTCDVIINDKRCEKSWNNIDQSTRQTSEYYVLLLIHSCSLALLFLTSFSRLLWQYFKCRLIKVLTYFLKNLLFLKINLLFFI